jgi:hypothetical protein
LTTPPRGTFSATTRWSATCGSLGDHSKMVDAGIAQAYVDIITSVPHGTPSVRRHGQRSAHSAGAPGHGIERNPKRSQTDARRPRVVRRRVYLAANLGASHGASSSGSCAVQRKRSPGRCIALA